MRSIVGATAAVVSRRVAPEVRVSVAAPVQRVRPTGTSPATLGTAQLHLPVLSPSGAVRDALAGGRLLRTGDPARLDHLEQVLRTGAIDESRAVAVGNGINGPLRRVPITDTLDKAAPETWAVEKSAGAQAAQEELGWRLARALGIDHLVPAVARRSDGIARIEHRPGTSLNEAGIHDLKGLEGALQRSYVADSTLSLSPGQARVAARMDAQLLQVFDYLLANNDRHAGNGLHDAASGVLSFIDSGHAGRGSLAANGGSDLEPVLRQFQAGPGGGRVNLDPAVVELIRTRVDPDTLRSLHAAVFDAPGIAGPQSRTIGERFLPHVRSTSYRDGMVARLEHLLEHGGYTHREYTGDNAGEMPALQSMQNMRGLRDVRAAMHGGGMHGGFDRF